MRTMKMLTLTTSLTLAAISTGCLIPKDGPRTGAVASGAQLAVVDDVKVWTTTSKEKVAETEYTDENGRSLGKASTYTDKTTVHTAKVWYPVQGTEQLSDEDFFRISGDQASLDQTMALRQSGKKWNRRGIGLMAGGVVGVIASYFVSNGGLRTGLLVAGGLSVSGGYYLSWWGANQMNPETHAVDRSVADRAANKYNESLTATGGLSLNKGF